jgi:GT2 family glycosyltransferase
MKTVLAIPTYNGATYLEKLLPQAVKQGFYKIYVLDDASTDNTVEVCERFPSVNIIRSKKNTGLIANRNRILDYDVGDVILFLDDDMSFETDGVPKLLENVFNEHPNTAIIGATVIDQTTNKPLIFTFERENNPLFRFFERPFMGPTLPASAFDAPYKEVAWVLEGASAIRSDIFRKLNGFDETFKRYNEGPDIGRRTRDAGYKVAMTNQIRFTHTRELNMYRLSHIPRFVLSSLAWYRKYTLKIK